MPGGRSAAVLGHVRLPIGAALLVLALAPAALGQENGSLEYAVKAAYLYKVAPFVEWPADAFVSPTSAVNLCVVGHDPFGVTLDQTVEGQRIEDRPILVHRLARVDGSSPCHILYAAGSDEQPVSAILEAVSGAPVLTFTDEARDPTEKGIVHFVISENRVRFEIDDQAAARNGLQISSRILSIALSVKQRS